MKSISSWRLNQREKEKGKKQERSKTLQRRSATCTNNSLELFIISDYPVAPMIHIIPGKMLPIASFLLCKFFFFFASLSFPCHLYKPMFQMSVAGSSREADSRNLYWTGTRTYKIVFLTHARPKEGERKRKI